MGWSKRWFRSNDGMERQAMDGMERAMDWMERALFRLNDGMERRAMDGMEQARDGTE